MFGFILLNSIAPKLRTQNENLVAQTRNWFTDGYRVSVPGTNSCREDSDCEATEICQSGYCTGLHRKYNTHGLFYGNEYRDDPWSTVDQNATLIDDTYKHDYEYSY